MQVSMEISWSRVVKGLRGLGSTPSWVIELCSWRDILLLLEWLFFTACSKCFTPGNGMFGVAFCLAVVLSRMVQQPFVICHYEFYGPEGLNAKLFLSFAWHCQFTFRKVDMLHVTMSSGRVVLNLTLLGNNRCIRLRCCTQCISQWLIWEDRIAQFVTTNTTDYIIMGVCTKRMIETIKRIITWSELGVQKRS